jgi:hypothetical protein
MSWYRAPLWDLRSDIISCRNVAVWNLRSCIYGAPSLTRGQVCNLQCNHSMVGVTQNLKPYFTVSSETSPTWRARFPYLYSPGTGWPSYTPGHWVDDLGLRSPRSEVLLRLTVSQSVCLVSSPPWDLRPDINSVWISLCCLCWAPSLTRGRVCLLSATVSNNCPSPNFFLLFLFVFPHFIRHTFDVYTIYARPSQPRLNTADHAPSFIAYTITTI